MEIEESGGQDVDIAKSLALEQIYADKQELSTAESSVIIERIHRTADFIRQFEEHGFGGKEFAEKLQGVFDMAKTKEDPKAMLAALKYASDIMLHTKSAGDGAKAIVNVQNNSVAPEDMAQYKIEQEIRTRKRKNG